MVVLRRGGRILGLGLVGILLCLGVAQGDAPLPTIDSLQQLALTELASRSYGSTLTYLKALPSDCYPPAQQSPLAGHAFMTAFISDGLREYARVDIPTAAPPAEGYPVVVFDHGWVGATAAPHWSFGCYAHTNYPVYAKLIGQFTAAGYIVVTPGYRGHGTVDGKPAEGLDYLLAWDNSTYLSPQFYAVDVMNLLASLRSLDAIDWPGLGSAPRRIAIDSRQIYLKGHSQGGDVALTVAAISAMASTPATRLAAVSIWSGTFANRLDQLYFYGGMQSTAQSWLAGDGSWNATPIATNGVVNHNFLFGYPSPDVISPDPSTWTWQNNVYWQPDVASAVAAVVDQMYVSLRAHIRNLGSAAYKLIDRGSERFQVEHDPRVTAGYADSSAFVHVTAVTQPIAFHHSDHDYYSPPTWNAAACERITDAGGRCQDYTYGGNTHELDVSDELWFSPPGSVSGFDTMIARDLALFAHR